MKKVLGTLGVMVFAMTTPCLASVSTDAIKSSDKYYWPNPAKNIECVEYARHFVKIPYGLFTLADKKKVINSTTAKSSSVAVINLGSSGHVAVVVSVDNSGSNRSIKIAEHNVPLGTKFPRYRTATCGSKISDCEKQLSILGYIRP